MKEEICKMCFCENKPPHGIAGSNRLFPLTPLFLTEAPSGDSSSERKLEQLCVEAVGSTST